MISHPSPPTLIVKKVKEAKGQINYGVPMDLKWHYEWLAAVNRRPKGQDRLRKKGDETKAAILCKPNQRVNRGGLWEKLN